MRLCKCSFLYFSSTFLLRKSVDWFLYDNGLRHERVKIGKKWRKILSPTYSLKFKNIILFLNRGLFFFSNGHIRNVVSTLPNVVKIDVENDSVVSVLSNVVQFNVEKHSVVSTLFYVVNFSVEIHNIVSKLIWRCATSRRHINPKTMWNRRWNVCWDTCKAAKIHRSSWKTCCINLT